MNKKVTRKLPIALAALVVLILVAAIWPARLLAEQPPPGRRERPATPAAQDLDPTTAAKLEQRYRGTEERHRGIEQKSRTDQKDATKALTPEEAIRKAKERRPRAKKVDSVKLEERKGKPVYVVSVDGKDVVMAITGEIESIDGKDILLATTGGGESENETEGEGVLPRP